MTRSIRLLLLVLILPFGLWGQDIKIKEGPVKMGKTKLWCFSARYNYDKTATTEAMEQNISRANIKRSSRKKGFSKYKGVSWTTFSNTSCDYYYKVRSKKGRSTVYLCVSKGYDNYVTSTSDAAIAGNINTYLQNLNEQIAQIADLKQKEVELKAMEKKNAEAQKQLDAAKKEEAEKAKQLQQAKRIQAEQPPVK